MGLVYALSASSRLVSRMQSPLFCCLVSTSFNQFRPVSPIPVEFRSVTSSLALSLIQTSVSLTQSRFVSHPDFGQFHSVSLCLSSRLWSVSLSLDLFLIQTSVSLTQSHSVSLSLTQSHSVSLVLPSFGVSFSLAQFFPVSLSLAPSHLVSLHLTQSRLMSFILAQSQSRPDSFCILQSR